MSVAANDDDWSEIGPRYGGKNPLDGHVDDRAFESGEPMEECADEEGTANAAARPSPADFRPQRAQAWSPSPSLPITSLKIMSCPSQRSR